ncbi:hypothetical protein K469DRAFT_706508 [Zopfia rhizophila CBS 207.26]|uniref:DUF985 domain-containing protein n=1 Tax=Zopfia rhizophila CBS 207.26 TaxID=1314779 RepID=A0A6A6E3Q6_9PEZI|nr:hypothetical protein K469DRAFT_706508 [Zopfia rhizophila CBS 207.26]
MKLVFCVALLGALVQNIAGVPHKHPPVETRSAREIIQELNLVANPEKGYFIETYEDPRRYGNRSYSTAIFYLLEGSVGPSYWHKVDATEVWHHYAGAPLRLDLSYNDGQPVTRQVLGDDIFDNQRPQVVINPNQWQRAESLGEWTLVGMTVAPGFVEEGFELVPPDWMPSGA